MNSNFARMPMNNETETIGCWTRSRFRSLILQKCLISHDSSIPVQKLAEGLEIDFQLGWATTPAYSSDCLQEPKVLNYATAAVIHTDFTSS